MCLEYIYCKPYFLLAEFISPFVSNRKKTLKLESLGPQSITYCDLCFLEERVCIFLRFSNDSLLQFSVGAKTSFDYPFSYKTYSSRANENRLQTFVSHHKRISVWHCHTLPGDRNTFLYFNNSYYLCHEAVNIVLPTHEEQELKNIILPPLQLLFLVLFVQDMSIAYWYQLPTFLKLG